MEKEDQRPFNEEDVPDEYSRHLPASADIGIKDIPCIARTSALGRDEKIRLPPEFQPSAYSVVIGRDKASMGAIGNRRLKIICSRFLDEYSNKANSRSKKGAVVSKIVDIVQDACHYEGGFVRFQDSCWWEVSDIVARERVGSILRDQLADQYLSSSKNKVDRKRRKKDASPGIGVLTDSRRSEGSTAFVNDIIQSSAFDLDSFQNRSTATSTTPMQMREDNYYAMRNHTDVGEIIPRPVHSAEMINDVDIFRNQQPPRRSFPTSPAIPSTPQPNQEVESWNRLMIEPIGSMEEFVAPPQHHLVAGFHHSMNSLDFKMSGSTSEPNRQLSRSHSAPSQTSFPYWHSCSTTRR